MATGEIMMCRMQRTVCVCAPQSVLCHIISTFQFGEMSTTAQNDVSFQIWRWSYSLTRSLIEGRLLYLIKYMLLKKLIIIEDLLK
jgi:hypothetical protein